MNFLLENDSYQAEMQEFLNLNKIELTEVVKSDENSDKISEKEQEERKKIFEEYDKGNLSDEDRRGKLFETAQKYKHLIPEPTKFQEYTLGQGEGGKNYKEFLLTLPVKETIIEGRYNYTARNEKGSVKGGVVSEADLPYVKESLESEGFVFTSKPLTENKEGFYKSSHWQEPNVVAHFRGDERMTVDGQKTFHIAEIQSDWHQDGRKKGYKSDVDIKKFPSNYSVTKKGREYFAVNEKGEIFIRSVSDTENGAKINYLRQNIDSEKGVPNAPFKKSWHELTFRRALKYAVDNGFDALTFDIGETSAERYELTKLSKHLL